MRDSAYAATCHFSPPFRFHFFTPPLLIILLALRRHAIDFHFSPQMMPPRFRHAWLRRHIA